MACEQCPRLRDYCREVATSKRRAYRDWNYWGRPIPGFGDPHARLWVLGLAPAAHGGNRTGRVFTGDSSGDWLFRALHDHGFARLPISVSRDDGQELRDAWVSAAARCAPPGNRPLPEELSRCHRYLERELGVLSELRVLLPLGKIAFDAGLRLLEGNGYVMPRPRPRFAHGACYELVPRATGPAMRPLIVLARTIGRQNADGADGRCWMTCSVRRAGSGSTRAYAAAGAALSWMASPRPRAQRVRQSCGQTPMAASPSRRR